MVHYLVIQRTSAVTTTVLGEVKIVAIIVLSAVVFGARPRPRLLGGLESGAAGLTAPRAAAGEGRAMTPRAALGCAAALLGFGLYSHAKLAAARRPEAALAKGGAVDAAAAVDARLGAREDAGGGVIKALRPVRGAAGAHAV